MKKLTFILLMAVMAVACHKSDNNQKPSHNPPHAVLENFSAKYTASTNAEWSADAEYEKVIFLMGTDSAVAWFTTAGPFMVGYTTVAISDLPDAVIKGLTDNLFTTSQLRSARRMERNNFSDIYLLTLNVNDATTVVDVTADGQIFKMVSSYSFGVPMMVADTVARHYPKAAMLEYDLYPDQSIEVDLLDQQAIKRMFLTKQGQWSRSYWQILESEIPGAVQSAIDKGEAYQGYTIAKAQIMQYPGVDPYYNILFSKAGSIGFTANFKADGSVILD